MKNSEQIRSTILIAEEDAKLCEDLRTTLGYLGYGIQGVADSEEVQHYLRAGLPVAAILVNMVKPSEAGFDSLREIRRMTNDIPVIVLSSMASPTNVVQAMKNGATDFLAKPLDPDELVSALDRNVRLVDSPSSPAGRTLGAEIFFGNDPAMCELKASLPKLAKSDIPVLIQGETGTGKEVLARQIHAMSARAQRPFIKLNCAAVPSDLMESELFGYERGAFTGAFGKKLGLFELADGGTILLDEIGDMEIRLQAKLLQVLQDHEFRRLGGKANVRIDVRIIAATHQNLQEAIRNHKFREDLFYRLNVVTLTVPPLRERQDDILSMAQFLIQRHSCAQAPALVLPASLRKALVEFHWPGNVRQLENIVRKLIVMREPESIAGDLGAVGLGGKIQLAPRADHGLAISLPRKKAASDPASRLEGALLAKEQAEAEVILEALQSTRWNRKQAAARLNIEYKALLYKMKKLSIEERATKLSLPA